MLNPLNKIREKTWAQYGLKTGGKAIIKEYVGREVYNAKETGIDVSKGAIYIVKGQLDASAYAHRREFKINHA